jgi:hypothetical protein
MPPQPAALLSPTNFAPPEHLRRIDRLLREANRTWTAALLAADVQLPCGWVEPAQWEGAVDQLRACMDWQSADRIEAAVMAVLARRRSAWVRA